MSFVPWAQDLVEKRRLLFEQAYSLIFSLTDKFTPANSQVHTHSCCDGKGALQNLKHYYSSLNYGYP